jgi:hypothetical protein
VQDVLLCSVRVRATDQREKIRMMMHLMMSGSLIAIYRVQIVEACFIVLINDHCGGEEGSRRPVLVHTKLTVSSVLHPDGRFF